MVDLVGVVVADLGDPHDDLFVVVHLHVDGALEDPLDARLPLLHEGACVDEVRLVESWRPMKMVHLDSLRKRHALGSHLVRLVLAKMRFCSLMH